MGDDDISLWDNDEGRDVGYTDNFSDGSEEDVFSSADGYGEVGIEGKRQKTIKT